MPVTRRQFELGIDQEIEDFMKKIYLFLAQRSDQAFGEEEIFQEHAVEMPDRLSALYKHPLHIALERLVEQEAAKKKGIRDRNYYTYGDKPLIL
jgi:hypothetical protein